MRTAVGIALVPMLMACTSQACDLQSTEPINFVGDIVTSPATGDSALVFKDTVVWVDASFDDFQMLAMEAAKSKERYSHSLVKADFSGVITEDTSGRGCDFKVFKIRVVTQYENQEVFFDLFNKVFGTDPKITELKK